MTPYRYTGITLTALETLSSARDAEADPNLGPFVKRCECGRPLFVYVDGYHHHTVSVAHTDVDDEHHDTWLES